MTDFEFLMALFGLLYALIVAELALKFADASDCSRSLTAAFPLARE